MPDSETINITELILEGSVAKTPISVRGSLKNGKLSDFSGWVKIDSSR